MSKNNKSIIIFTIQFLSEVLFIPDIFGFALFALFPKLQKWWELGVDMELHFYHFICQYLLYW